MYNSNTLLTVMLGSLYLSIDQQVGSLLLEDRSPRTLSVFIQYFGEAESIYSVPIHEYPGMIKVFHLTVVEICLARSDSS